MNWLKLTPDSISNFIALAQSVLTLLYLLSLKNKSRDTKSLITYLSLLTLVIFTGFLQRTGPADWQHYLFLAKICNIMLMLTALIYFAQTFLLPKDQQNPNQSFKLLLFLLAIALTGLCLGQMGFGLIRSPRFFIFFIPLFLLILAIAPSWIFFRRAINENTNKQTTFFADLKKTVGNRAIGLRNFGILSILPWVMMISGLLAFFGFFSLILRDLIITTLGFVYILGFLILYLSHAREKISVNLKLIAVSLASAFLVLQVIVSLLFTSERLAADAGASSLNGHSVIFNRKITGGYHIIHNDFHNNEDHTDSLPTLNNETSTHEVNDDKPIELGFNFPFYQQQWGAIYINNNGFVTFSQPHQLKRAPFFRSIPETFNDLKNTPAIMVFNSLSIKKDNRITTYKKYPEKIIIHWYDDRSEFNNQSSSFQLQLISDGSIKFHYYNLTTDMSEGLIGISPGTQSSEKRVLELPMQLFEKNVIDSPTGYAITENLTQRYRQHAHQQLSKIAMVIVITAFLIIVTFPWFYRHILIHPFKSLLNGLKSVDQGKFDTKIAINSRDELSILARHFNAMISSLKSNRQQLKDYAQQLEAKVQKRTQELDEKNTQLEQQWQQLQQLDQSKSRLFANVSHEFRTPLTLTLGSLKDIRNGLYGQQSPQILKQLDLAMRNSRTVLRLINQMLDIAKIEDEQMDFIPQKIDLSELLKNIGRIFSPLAERKKMDFSVNVSQNSIWIDGDPEQLDKVFCNLLANAFKFTPDGGIVHMCMERLSFTHKRSTELHDSTTHDWISIIIRDNGPGIPSDQINMIFQRFYQAENHNNHLTPGTGIGLALCKELVNLHNGRIKASSEMGFGACFTVDLPLSKNSASDELKQTINDGTGNVFAQTQQHVWDLIEETKIYNLETTDMPLIKNNKSSPDQTTILVVDDNPEIRAYVAKHLSGQYHLIEADNGLTALELANDYLPDLVISDLMMPKMDGLSLCKAIKQNKQLQYLPVILLTAKVSESDKLQGLGTGADDYIEKPFNMPELLARVNNLIESRKKLKAHFTRPIELTVSDIKVDSADQVFLNRVQNIIEQRLEDPDFNVEKLANEVGQSRGNLHRRLRTTIDQTPTDLIRNIRLQRGADLLSQKAGSISEIAYAVGFKGVAHFSTTFRSKYGVPPSSY